MNFTISPGCDLHLIVGAVAPGGVAQTIKVLSPTAAADVAAHANTTYNGFDPAVVTVANGVFTPVAAGITAGFVRYMDSNGTVVTGYLRVRVHAVLRNLWFGNSRITIRAGASDYVPTVFAEFDDLPMADVTGHAWLSPSVVGTGAVSMTPGDAFGRLTADGLAAGRQETIAMTAGALRATTSVHVVAGVSEPRPYLNALRYYGLHTTRRNILFLPEGFPDEATFEQTAIRIVDTMFSSPAHSPYPQLREHMNVWTAWEPSAAGTTPEIGVTVGPEVNAKGNLLPILADAGTNYSIADLIGLVGYPNAAAPVDAAAARIAWAASAPTFDPLKLVDGAFDLWRQHVVHGITMPKDSTFGFMLGGRTSGPDAPDPQPPTANLPAGANVHWELFPTLPTIMHPGDGPAFLYEEEIQRAGVRITRSWQRARWSNGATYVWLGRRRTVARGGGPSGLGFDELTTDVANES